MRKTFVILLVFLVLSAILYLVNSNVLYFQSNIGGLDNGNSPDKLDVYTSIYPLFYIVEKIAGDHVNMTLIVPNGAELHNYHPSPHKLAGLEKADLFIYNGLGLEPWAQRAVQNLQNGNARIINASELVNLIPIESSLNEAGKSKEAGDEEKKETEYDPHIWLDPVNMKKIASGICDQLIRLDSTNQTVYRRNYRLFAQELDRLDREFKEGLADKKQEYILVSHAAFGYLAKRYGFKQLTVSGITPHAEPSPAKLAHLVEFAERYNLEYIFMETLTNPRIVNILALEAGLKVLPLNPFAGLTEKEKENQEDYFSIMRKNLHNLRKALVE